MINQLRTKQKEALYKLLEAAVNKDTNPKISATSVTTKPYRKAPEVKETFDGFTFTVGNKEYNLFLSRPRSFEGRKMSDGTYRPYLDIRRTIGSIEYRDVGGTEQSWKKGNFSDIQSALLGNEQFMNSVRLYQGDFQKLIQMGLAKPGSGEIPALEYMRKNAGISTISARPE